MNFIGFCEPPVAVPAIALIPPINCTNALSSSSCNRPHVLVGLKARMGNEMSHKNAHAGNCLRSNASYCWRSSRRFMQAIPSMIVGNKHDLMILINHEPMKIWSKFT